jgi:hypothetical protein
MGNVVYSTKYKKNTGAVLSPTELKELFLYGINSLSRDGSVIPVSVWEQKIRVSQDRIEKFLAIKLCRQLVMETLNYFRDDYLFNLPILNTQWPVYKPVRLLGLLNNTEQVKYPTEWLNNYIGSDDMSTRRINLVPSGASVGTSSNILLIGIMAQLGIRSLNLVPNYWTAQYLTGWSPNKMPSEIVDIIGKLAAIQILAIWGDIILPPGLSGSSLSIDGLSQNITTPISSKNSAFGGRISQYTQDIKDTLQQLERTYKGLNFVVL